eukprot:Gregarina_sp_Poly_1__2532@NODE_1688_length_3532_cov_181_327273_g1056_i1_p1_GENE_NODE_1688_length_3532_cov_181_327273_g1056_i1NODE_1688_length_3532_cov_181_327273_g1056_i1_p1_ORF_typecomplete_len289_score18_90Cyclin/PF08613_11/2_6e18Cyclin_N/PF00134_23/7_4e08_NODE_1688_length_3532_cov_181_327273_g1056_i14251291
MSTQLSVFDYSGNGSHNHCCLCESPLYFFENSFSVSDLLLRHSCRIASLSTSTRREVRTRSSHVRARGSCSAHTPFPAVAPTPIDVSCVALIRYVWLLCETQPSHRPPHDFFVDCFLNCLYDTTSALDDQLCAHAKWLQQIAARLSSSPVSSVLVALIYVDRLMARHPALQVTRQTALRLIICALVVSTKYVDDDRSCRSETVASLTGLQPRVIRHLELLFLSLLDFRIYVSQEVFESAKKTAQNVLGETSTDQSAGSLAMSISCKELPLIDDCNGEYWEAEFGPIAR